MQELKENIRLIAKKIPRKEFFANLKKTKNIRRIFLVSLLGLFVCLIYVSISSINVLKTANMDNEDLLTTVAGPIASTSSKKDIISIPAGVVKANPFVPYRNLDKNVGMNNLVMDVPQFDLVAPPDYSEESSEKAKIMETAVSGILFDKFSPSAILKINGTDYLVKKGDVIQNYKVVSIAKDSVTVQSGKNTFKAGIGELLTGGEVNYNEVSNLNKKFGGEQR